MTETKVKSAILMGARETRPPRWEWVPHGSGWALMQDQYIQFSGEMLWFPVHGMNRLTVSGDGFDSTGAELRKRIVDMLNAEDP